MSDPTRIDIDFDPTEQRMRGVAIHGNTPFDAPFISQITDNLWQGGCERGLVLPEFIDHVVSLYPWEAYTINHKLESSLTVRMYDDLAGPDREQVEALARWVNVCRKTGTVLVHCQAGLNRSGLIAAAALMLSAGCSADLAISMVRRARSDAVLCNPSFSEWLHDWEESDVR